MMIKESLAKIRRIPSNIYNKLVFFLRKPVCSKSKPYINGKIYMVSDKKKICFGDHVRINSSLKSNPIGGSSRTILFAEPGASIKIGDRVGISNSALHASKSITIGNDVLIGGDCKIYDTDFHSTAYESRMNDRDIKSKEIVIEDGAFIGAGCYILKGVHIGEKSVVAAASIVTKNIPSGELWGGNPAKFIRKLDGSTDIGESK